MNSIRTVYSSRQSLSVFLRRRRLKTPKLSTLSAFLHTSSSCHAKNKTGGGSFDPSSVPLERIRNFSIVAHVDHGKSTLADRILELVGAVEASADNKQILDKLPVERERGITVKAQTASVIYEHKGETLKFYVKEAASQFCCSNIRRGVSPEPDRHAGSRRLQL